MTTDDAKAVLDHFEDGGTRARRARTLKNPYERDPIRSVPGRICSGKVDAAAPGTDDRVCGSPAVRDA